MRKEHCARTKQHRRTKREIVTFIIILISVCCCSNVSSSFCFAPSSYLCSGVKSDMACCLLSSAVEVFITRLLVSTVSSCNDSLELTSQRLHLMQKMNVEPPLGVEMGCDVGKQMR